MSIETVDNAVNRESYTIGVKMTGKNDPLNEIQESIKAIEKNSETMVQSFISVKKSTKRNLILLILSTLALTAYGYQNQQTVKTRINEVSKKVNSFLTKREFKETSRKALKARSILSDRLHNIERRTTLMLKQQAKKAKKTKKVQKAKKAKIHKSSKLCVMYLGELICTK